MITLPTGSRARSSERPLAHPNDDHALHAVANAADPQSMLRAMEVLFESRGFKAPWAVPELVPLRQFVAQHLARKAKKVTPATLTSLTTALTNFRHHCGDIALQQLKGQHVQDWIDKLEHLNYAGGTICKMMAAVRGMLSRAKGLGWINVNPCEDVELPSNETVLCRQEFPQTEFDCLVAYLEGARDTEWLTMVLLGRYAGVRLGDAAAMHRSNVRVIEGVTILHFTAIKTGSLVEIPIYGKLKQHLLSLPDGPLCPSLALMSPSTLSHAFNRRMDLAGIAVARLKLPNGRELRLTTFHGMRHAFASELLRRGVPEHICRKMCAHQTVSANRKYQHVGALDLHQQIGHHFE